ncbi:MAG: glycosyltransferase family 2 protein [Candidatus Altiarchaeota archaeon]
MDLSVVIPTYNEEENLQVLYSKLKTVLENLKKSYEIIFIDDGSTDRSFEILKELHEKDKTVRVIKFRKNFGQTAAISAGFENSKGKVIVTMDSDLQNDPNDIPRLLSKLDEGYDIVSGWRKNRKDPWLKKKIPSKISNFLARKLTSLEIHDFGCTLKAYRKEALKGIELYGEMHRFIPAIVAWRGFKVSEVQVEHHRRKFGKTKYGLWRIMKGFLDLLVVVFWRKYSTRPIHLFGSLGIVLSFFGFLIGVYLTLMKIFYNQSLSNRPLLLLSILLIILGAQFIIFGLLADIMIRLYYRGGEKSYNIERILE